MPITQSQGYFCAIAKSNHQLCHQHQSKTENFNEDEVNNLGINKQHKKHHSEMPAFCNPMVSNWSSFVHVADKDLPFIATYVPFCTSHLRCGWLYILVVGSIAFLTSCLLAVCFVQCCCR